MFVQPDNLVPLYSEEDCSDLQVTKPEDMKTVSATQHKIHPYKTFKQGQPAVTKEVGVSLKTSIAQRKQAVMHMLARLDIAGKSIPANEQKTGSNARSKAHIHEFVVKSTAFYFLTFPKPTQNSVCT